MIKKISNDMYKGDIKSEAINKAKSLSRSEENVFSVIYSQCWEDDKHYYYIERGAPFIRISETLIDLFKNGVSIK